MKWRTLCCVVTAFVVRPSSGDILPVNDFVGYQNGVYGTPPQQKFWSSNITAPIFNYGTWRKDISGAADDSDHLFLTIGYDVQAASGPYIFQDDDLSLVYADPSFDYAMNARVQSIDGKDYLTFWHGARNRGDSQGFCVGYDEHYRVVWNVTLGPPFTVDADMHECEVTPDGTVLLTAYQDKKIDLTPLGGKTEDVLADGCFQEVGLRGVVLFSWCASEWFEVGLGYWSLTGPSRRRRDDKKGDYTTSSGFDVYHINSLQKTKEGNYLASLRNLKLLTYIDGKTGKPIWNLGGKINEFVDITSASVLDMNPDSDGALSFGWQHHARFSDDGLTQITIFDNHELENGLNCSSSKCSRGRHIEINTSDPDKLTVQLIRDYRSPRRLSSVIFGSMQPLQGPSSSKTSSIASVLLGWGVSPTFSEHTTNGEVIRDVQYGQLDPEHSFSGGGSASSYRVLKHSWHGYPPWPPEAAVSKDGTLWVSWNGATEVRSWALYGSHQADLLGPEYGNANGKTNLAGMSPLKSASREGFETGIEYGAMLSAFIKVAALNAKGEIIGMTRTLDTRRSLSASSCLVQDTMSFTCLIRLLV